MNCGQLFIYPFSALIAHQTCDRHWHAFQYFSFSYKNHSTLLGDQAVHRKFHLFVTDSDNNDVVRIMSDRQGNCSGFDSVTFQESTSYISCSLVSFHYGYLYDIFFRISYKFTILIQLDLCCIFGSYYTTRKDLDDIHFIGF